MCTVTRVNMFYDRGGVSDVLLEWGVHWRRIFQAVLFPAVFLDAVLDLVLSVVSDAVISEIYQRYFLLDAILMICLHRRSRARSSEQSITTLLKWSLSKISCLVASTTVSRCCLALKAMPSALSYRP